MKTTFLLLVFSFLEFSAWGQVSGMKELDNMLDEHDKSKKYVTARVANSIIYDAQRFVGGTAVKQGKLLGTNATIDDQSLTLNIGSNIFARRFSVQGTVAGTGESDFLSLFKQGDYQKTVTLGGTANLFLNGIHGKTFLFFDTVNQSKFHRRLRSLRNRDRDSLENLIPAVRTGVWNTRYAKAVGDFCNFWNNGFNKDILTNLRSKVISLEDYSANRGAIYQYETLCQQVRQFLPDDWENLSYADATTWVQSNLGNEIQQASRIELIRTISETALQKKRLAVYDSIQLAAPWRMKKVNWFTFSYLKNRDKQSLFTSPSANTLDITSMVEWSSTYRFGFNHLVLYYPHHLRWYYGLTGSLNTQRLFADQETTTRYAVDSHYLVVNRDTVRTISQAKAFDAEAVRPFLLGLKFQGSVFSESLKLGLDATGQWQASRITEPHYVATIGIFLPISAGESTLIVMPQAKYDSRTYWTVGFNLSAAIPGFVTKKEL